jgi:hypothetical protein
VYGLNTEKLVKTHHGKFMKKIHDNVFWLALQQMYEAQIANLAQSV